MHVKNIVRFTNKKYLLVIHFFPSTRTAGNCQNKLARNIVFKLENDSKDNLDRSIQSFDKDWTTKKNLGSLFILVCYKQPAYSNFDNRKAKKGHDSIFKVPLEALTRPAHPLIK